MLLAPSQRGHRAVRLQALNACSTDRLRFVTEPFRPCHHRAQDANCLFRHLGRVTIVKEHSMTVARITEISSISTVSFQDAIVTGIERANKTLKNVKGAWIKDQEVTIDNGKVTGYKVILKVSFVLND